MKIEITTPEVTVFSGTARRDGRPFSIRLQEGWADTGKAYLERFELVLRDDQQPYAPGTYKLSKDSIYVDRNRRLAISPRLVPATPATAAVVNSEKKAS